MRFFSIFAARNRSDEASDALAVSDGAMRAANLFGVPRPQLTREVRAALNAMMGEIDALRFDVDLLKDQLAEAEESADHDALVAVYNRRAFLREAGKIASLVRRREAEASLIFFDLNGFKEINDLHGHAAGDLVLRAVGETLIRQTRPSDVVGRIGGDEFAVVLAHLDKDAATAKAEVLAATLRTERIHHDGLTLGITASFGIAHFGPNDGAERVLARADEAMYRDKALHRRARMA